MENIKYLDMLAQYGIDSAHPGGFMLTKAILRNEKITPETTLLDVGCGTGKTSAYIATHYPCKLMALDINPQMLEKARQKFAQSNLKISLIQGDATDLPFGKNYFDILLTESVTIFTNFNKSLREYYRVLKPGGILLEVEVTALALLADDEMKEIEPVLGINCVPTKDEWREKFQKAGFSNVQVLWEHNMNLMNSFSPKINRVFNEYLKTMFRYRKKIGFGVYRCSKV